MNMTMKYQGEVIYVYAYDLAYEMRKLPIREILGQPVAQFMVDSSKRSPKHLFFYKPQMVRLPSTERIGPKGTVRVERTVKLLPVGAISITVKVPFEVNRIEELVDYHDLQFTNGSLQDEVRALAEQVRQELLSYCIRPVPNLADEEAYTVFCIKSPVYLEGKPIGTTDWLKNNRRKVAALLTEETDTAKLSEQEVEESTGRFLSYYEHDLVVTDWNAALIIDNNFDETLYALELANLQLAELEAYDRILDDALDRSYRDMVASSMRGKNRMLHELRELRIDLARCSDELSNITKFFGDYHLAHVYEQIAQRFHLADWHKTIDNKLKTLDNLYMMLVSERNNYWMLMLEITIVLLFVVDVIVLLLGIK